MSSASAKPATVDSAKPATVDDTPDACFARLLVAMRAGDEAAVARETTANGRASLEKGAGTEDRKVVYARWGNIWTKWEIRWRRRDAQEADATLGPEIKEHGLHFVRENGVWKLDRWTPGE